MKVESGHDDIDFRERRARAVATAPLETTVAPLPCPLCGGRLRRMGMTDNFNCALGHQTTAKRLEARA